ncbi:hypothetical protein [Elizabethkingia anophelis]|uniref:hypothetical protein n=1 Tax=Elizabethkingia anophelis TaxID=1117645 RepID=UPI0012B18B5C|nr:hypothetical protein [Elizabethkingia anophelis]MCT4140384.1 hypothetical protein [Elizabethkingia anophelis]MCT4275311.1 hypothetical protein [Elizabethkingia anophelis]MCT4279403.1 hypothetical protein [Elizabethkingia anophelis]QGN21666.1 hypothetical protein GJV56_03060 [Elizabethkingia anophelis]QNV08327.1 hypothetical protein EIY88_03060 [Elizabethkingia anophelis]
MSLGESLKAKQVRYITIDNVDYFYVEDIKKEFQFFILDAKEVIYIDDIPVIDGKFVHKLSEFDLNMKQVLNFKPKKDKES